jgi:hypothetical protein
VLFELLHEETAQEACPTGDQESLIRQSAGFSMHGEPHRLGLR